MAPSANEPEHEPHADAQAEQPPEPVPDEADLELEGDEQPAGDARELGERLRAAVDRDEADGDDDDEPEPEPPASAAAQAEQPAPAAVATDDVIQKLEREKGRHIRAVEKLLGPEVPLVECDRCEGMGALPPWLVDDAPELEFPDDPHRHECASCRGLGGVKTGSKVQSQEVLICLDCKGRGWQGDDQAAEQNGSHEAPPGWDPAWGPPPAPQSVAS